MKVKSVLNSAILFALCAFGARLVQLLQLYFTPTPNGGNFVERPLLAFSCALIVELAAFALLGGLFTITKFFKGIASKICSVAFSVLFVVYVVFCGVNDHVMRWMGQHLTFSFLSTYSVSRMEPTLVKNVISEGWGSFALSIALAIIIAVFVGLIFKFKKRERPNKISLAVLLAIQVAVLAFSAWAPSNIKPCRIRWQRIQPLYYTLYSDYSYQREHSVEPENFKAGVEFLGGNANEKYPFYHFESNEDSLMNAFKAKALSEKKDVIVLSLESFRGWVGDMRIGKNCERMPNLCNFAKSSAVFPYAYSVGYPSTEGMLGMQLGIWSHPNKIFLSNLMNVNVRSLPDILGAAGYHRVFLTAAEPSFDNFTPWFEKWADYYEYDAKNNEDIPLANRFKELYNSMPKDKPLYFEWINFVTHTPFIVPKSYAEPAETSDGRYAQAVAYLDKALGIIFETIASSPRANNTIVFVTGDHSIANARAQAMDDKLGEANSTYTWTTMMFGGEGIPQGTFTKVASHAAFAPTLLKLLGIVATNNFVGHDLFEESENKVFSFRHSDAVLRHDSLMVLAQIKNELFTHARYRSSEPEWDTTETIGGFIAERKLDLNVNAEAQKLLEARDAWEWILDRNLLMPAK